jgi:hypothetical protein
VSGRVRPFKDGERAPEAVPRRYIDSNGYVRLRWPAPEGGCFIEAAEHRLVADAKSGEHVHHLNHKRADNRPENLVVLSPSEHGKAHRSESVDVEEMQRLYALGWSTHAIGERLGHFPMVVYNALRRHGVAMRGGDESHYRVALDPEEVRRLAEAGVAAAAIARHLGVSRTPVIRMIDALGLPKLPRGPHGADYAEIIASLRSQAAGLVR